jgi:glutamate racemase
MTQIHPSQPIGVFDSGIGGITVLKALAQHFPHENFIYLGDTARLPYGSKSPETIASYSRQNIEYLYDRGVKAIVIACNSASSHCPIDMYHSVPIYNVITPGARAAVNASITGRIGVLGTRATVNSLSYTTAIKRLEPEFSVHQQACPLFVPLAEEGLVDDEITRLVAQRYLEPLFQQDVDTVILGCTHYPILKPTLQRMGPEHLQWIDSGEAMAELLDIEFSHDHLGANPDTQSLRTIEVLTTDSSDQFIKMAQTILNPLVVNSFSLVHVSPSGRKTS